MIPEKEDGKKYSYADYLTWGDEERVELINGEIRSMSPAPTRMHQKISMFISNKIFNFLEGKPCQVYSAPFDVRFVKEENMEEQDIFITLQPDISVICDPDKLDDKGCLGSPDLIVEIISPSTGYKDENQKLSIYEEYGVKEYWIVSPERKTVQVFHHNGSDYDKPLYYKGDEAVPSKVLKGFQVELNVLFTP